MNVEGTQTAAGVSESSSGAPPTYLLTWNPANWPWDTLHQDAVAVQEGKCPEESGWSCGNTRKIRKGDRLFLLKQGEEPKGIIASGIATSDVYEEEHWNPERAKRGEKARYVRLDFDALIDSQLVAPMDPRSLVPEVAKGVHWATKMSGITVNGEVAPKLEQAWRLYLESIGRATRDAVTAPDNERPPETAKYWALALGPGGKYWDECYRDGLAVVDGELGDLRSYRTKEAFSDALRNQRDEDCDPVNDALMCYQFCYEMRAGDHVIAKIGRDTVLGMGTVESGYRWDETREAYRDVRRVRWFVRGRLKLPKALRVPIKTLTDISSCSASIEYIKKNLPRDGNAEVGRGAESYTVEDALSGLFIPRAEFVSLLADWSRKKNAIVQGPPGVGKTFIAKRLAYALMEAVDPSRVEMVQFHQSYAYEDFVQGWRPKEDGGFYLKSGIFYNFCRRAAADPGRRYVFIIDEINRGNLSRILGELMFLIEPDHRGEKFAIPLTYSKNADERFCVPANLYILGMMNTADRSLSMVDYALRRRFCFSQLQPAYCTSEFKQFLSARVSPLLIDRIVDRMTVLNGHISKDKNLGRGFEIGHSFFCPIDGEMSLDGAWYEAVIKREIAPLVREYWFDDLENAERLIADLLK